MKIGTADYRTIRLAEIRENQERAARARDRARNRAYTQLANLHPQDWVKLYAAALAEEEDLTPDTIC